MIKGFGVHFKSDISITGKLLARYGYICIQRWEGMECNRDEALRAKEIAEKKFAAKDIHGAKKFALKAQTLFPALEGISQMIVTMDVYIAAEVKVKGERDWYGIMSVNTSADDETLKKQFKKLALQLHPDKNKSVGAEGAFQLISEAWTILSDKAKRALYDQKRNIRVFQQNTSQAKTQPGTSNGFYNFSGNAASKAREERHKAGMTPVAPAPTPTIPHPPPFPPISSETFWTACTKCKVQYEYMRIYLRQNLLCPNCKEPFFAIETAMPTVGVTPVKQDSNSTGEMQNAGNNTPFKWGAFSRTAGAASATASSTAAAQAANVVHQTYEKVRREREEAQAAARKEEALRRKNNALKRTAGASENLNPRMSDGMPAKKMRFMGNTAGVGSLGLGRAGQDSPSYFKVPSGNISCSARAGSIAAAGPNGVNVDILKSRYARPVSLSKAFSSLNMKKMLIEKMKFALRDEVKELYRKRTEGATNGGAKKKRKLDKNEAEKETDAEDGTLTKKQAVPGDGAENGSGDKTESDSEEKDQGEFCVPDPDFYNFDQDRTEKSFEDDQIWASYDDQDGMPRYYAYVQKVISVEPFKLKISFLSSRSNSEFGPLEWVSAGFTKSCGDFRIGRYETSTTLNMYSHKVKWEKGPRGTIKIFPKKGDVWALYRNWSPDWNEDTDDDVILAYDMVEVVDDYSEDHGISVSPLIKIAGFKTVFRRNPDPSFVKKIPKEEMFRFSHQVPSYKLLSEEAKEIPEDCYELDPAAVSEELLQVITESNVEPKATAEQVS